MGKQTTLLAALLLLAACSADDPLVVVGGGMEEGLETNPSCCVSFSNGIEASVGELDETHAVTDRSLASDKVYFDLHVSDDVLAHFEEYVISVDDFAIRVGGEYRETDVTPTERTDNWNFVKINDWNGFTVRVAEVDPLDFYVGGENVELTFEVFLWVRTLQPTPDPEAGVCLPLFDTYDYLKWIGKTYGDMPLDEDAERGVDITLSAVAEDGGAVLRNVGSNAVVANGYKVRYSVYRGLCGNMSARTGLGDTPYLKVAIMMNKIGNDEPTEIIPIVPEN